MTAVERLAAALSDQYGGYAMREDAEAILARDSDLARDIEQAPLLREALERNTRAYHIRLHEVPAFETCSTDRCTEARRLLSDTAEAERCQRYGCGHDAKDHPATTGGRPCRVHLGTGSWHCSCGGFLADTAEPVIERDGYTIGPPHEDGNGGPDHELGAPRP
jgi:hypothetical protein